MTKPYKITVILVGPIQCLWTQGKTYIDKFANPCHNLIILKVKNDISLRLVRIQKQSKPLLLLWTNETVHRCLSHNKS